MPNILTISRLLLIPVFAYALLADGFSLRWVAAIAFGIAAATDWLDGFIARKLNQVTEFGKIVDPLVDRVLIASAIFVLYIKISNVIPLWAIIIIVGRDLMMVIGWLYISHRGKRMSVIRSGRLATATLMMAFFLLFVNVQLSSNILETASIWLFYTGMALSLISGLSYLKIGNIIMRSNQAES
ncbi:MAG: CDP-diacylglycerol--glycerol-3-phosphate 3-phosphatidyltransferase [Actinobacteria bacterium]|nr:CDP-diacylglycerol--glycerol-3-phosphate 3-phosphatidyltransferase [Actinomycetota bacterium]